MGIFDDQIKERLENDNQVFSEAFLEMSGVVMGKRALADILKDQSRQAKNAIFEILSFYHIAPQELPSNIKQVSDQLDYLLRPTGIMRRDVKLEGDWYRNGIGPLLATTVDGAVIALIPGRISGYTYFDAESGKTVRVTKKNSAQICDEALCFYKPFPQRPMTAKDLFRYFAQSVTVFDWLMIVVASLAVTGIGMLLTYANGLIFGKVIDVGEMGVFFAAFTLLVGVSVASLLTNVIKSLFTARINTKMSVSVESAAMMRLLSLPTSFFKEFSSGDLANRLTQIKMLCTSVSSILLGGGLTALLSLAYVGQIFSYAPALTVPAIVVVLVTLAIFLIVSSLQMNNFKEIMEAESKERGLVYSLISGIQKIKLSGAEKRSFSKWAKLYKKTAERKYNPQTVVKLVNAIILAVNTLGTILIYYFAANAGVGVAQYMAFSVAYGMVSGAFMTLIATSSEISQIKPGLELIRPILEATPEVAEDKHVITRLSGAIELNNITFRYSESMPPVINGLNLKINAGQYVAIVGSTGCGKSTLMRIMLGFEQPQKGTVYYDGKNLATLDLHSLRSRIGVVMQNGKLFSGDIYSNIVISAPQLSMDGAWEAAEMAGMAEDIRKMPMGMHTIISEGSGGISGGQKQRLMIARAVAPKPRILMFDEATSALDNLTQKHVSDALEKLKCTRVVIAHRLSTIRNCDRIIVLDQGRIVEDGTYDALIAKGGMFAELVEWQRVDI